MKIKVKLQRISPDIHYITFLESIDFSQLNVVNTGVTEVAKIPIKPRLYEIKENFVSLLKTKQSSMIIEQLLYYLGLSILAYLTTVILDTL